MIWAWLTMDDVQRFLVVILKEIMVNHQILGLANPFMINPALPTLRKQRRSWRFPATLIVGLVSGSMWVILGKTMINCIVKRNNSIFLMRGWPWFFAAMIMKHQTSRGILSRLCKKKWNHHRNLRPKIHSGVATRRCSWVFHSTSFASCPNEHGLYIYIYIYIYIYLYIFIYLYFYIYIYIWKRAPFLIV